jgi:hypothetical protein
MIKLGRAKYEIDMALSISIWYLNVHSNIIIIKTDRVKLEIDLSMSFNITLCYLNVHAHIIIIKTGYTKYENLFFIVV